MRKVAVIAVLLVLSACSHGAGIAQHAGVERVSLACPALPTSLGYAVSTSKGPDFLECAMSPLHAGMLRFNMYIGNHPPHQHELKFFGFTPIPAGTLAWFSTAAGVNTQWVTYVPTGHQFPSVVVLSVESGSAPSLLQLGLIAEVVVSHSPNISIQRTRYARR